VTVRRFLAFWYDFVVGDDPIVAVGVVVALVVTALLARGHVTAWWVLPVATAIVLCGSLVRAVRAARRSPN
jgi:hypothetical protein